MKIIAGRASEVLANKISQLLGLELTKVSVGNYPSGEFFCTIEERVEGEDVFVIQSTAHPVNENIMEALLIVGNLSKLGAKTITLVAPYFGYSRQDVAGSAQMVVRIMEGAGVDKFVVVDSHSEMFRSFFSSQVMDLSICGLIEKDLKKQSFMGRNTVFVSPDLGRISNVKELAQRFCTSFAYIEKIRDAEGVVHLSHIIGEIAEKDCIIVDDIVDSGGTLCNAIKALKKAGAKSIKAYVTHAVLSCCSVNEILQVGLDELVVTDSIDNVNLKMTKGFRSITMSGLIASAIEKVCSNRKPISNLLIK